MGRAFSRLSGDMKKLAFSIDKEISQTMLDLTANAVEQISISNPIDTGLSSGNWQASVNRPSPVTEGGILHPDREGEIGLRSFYPAASKRRADAIKKTKIRAQRTYVLNTISYVRDLNLSRGLWIERGVDRALITTRMRKLNRR